MGEFLPVACLYSATIHDHQTGAHSCTREPHSVRLLSHNGMREIGLLLSLLLLLWTLVQQQQQQHQQQ